MTTNLLSSLKAVVRPEIVKSPVLAKRLKLIERLEEQLAMVHAKLTSQPFSMPKIKTVKDPESGEKTTVEVPRKIRPWYFDNNHHFYLEVKFAGKVLELQPNMPTINVGELSELPKILQLIIAATEKGELDDFLRLSDENKEKSTDKEVKKKT